jgi:hypothetical protein
MLAKVQPGQIRRLLKIVEPDLGFDSLGLVDGDNMNDNGIGFGQGSTAGILGANYPKMKRVSESCGGCGFASDINRPRIPEEDCRVRNQFNLHRLCTSPYSTHFDPTPNRCRTDSRSGEQKCAVVPVRFSDEESHLSDPSDEKRVFTTKMGRFAAYSAFVLIAIYSLSRAV